MNSIKDKNSFIHAFRQSSPYINAHRKKTFVLLLDGKAVQSPKLPGIVNDIALLNSLGVRIVLVYGIRSLIEEELAKQGIASEFRSGRRITSYPVLEIIMQISGKCRFELEALFSQGLPNSPMHGSNIRTVSGNFITAKPLGVIDGCDFQFAGGVRKVDTGAIESLLVNDNIVLLSNIGQSPTAECFNIAAEDVAVAAASALRADKLIVFTAEDKEQKLPRELMPRQAESLLAGSNDTTLRCMLDACQSGVKRCHLISFETDGSLLLELFTTDGVGTLLSSDPFESIRQATIADVGGIISLLEPLEEKGILVKRERELLEQEIHHFIVIERDGIVIACSALYLFDNGAAEIACVVTHPDYRGNSRGAQMLAFLEKKASEHGLTHVFVLTTQTAHFFLEQGFSESSLDALPKQKQQLYNYQRNSKVFSKKIS